MDGVWRSGVTAPGVTSRLQPGRESRASASDPGAADLPHVDLEEHLADADQGAGLDQDELAQLKEATQRLRRRGEDQAIVAQLATQGFTGPLYETALGELVAYAFPVIMSWIRRGLIFRLCAERRRPVTAPDPVRQHLADNRDDRLELANETIAEALQVFIRYGLRGGRWSASGGASLKTYLVGACINAFPNVFRRWLAEQDQPGTHYTADMPAAAAVGNPLYPAIHHNPMNTVVAWDSVQEELALLDPDLREIAARMAFTEEPRIEITRALGLSDRAVEGRFYRYRKERQERDQNRRPNDQPEGGTP